MCYSLGRKEFDALLGPIEDVWRFEALRKVPVLFALSEQQLFELAHCMKNHAIAAGQMVFRQGDPGALSGHPDASSHQRWNTCVSGANVNSNMLVICVQFARGSRVKELLPVCRRGCLLCD